MDCGKNDKRFYVYLHRNESGEVVYVGKGTGNRFKSKCGRSEDHLNTFEKLSFQVVQDKLSSDEAIYLENCLLKIYNCAKLLNKVKSSVKNKDCIYEYFNQFVYYDPSSKTLLKWKVDRRSRKNNRLIAKQGSDAGSFDSKGYVEIAICSVRFKVHRILWCLYKKEDLESNLLIDHINGDRSDNSEINLRKVTYFQNNQNRSNSKEDYNLNFYNKRWYATYQSEGVKNRKAFPALKYYPNLQKDIADAKCKILAKSWIDIHKMLNIMDSSLITDDVPITFIASDTGVKIPVLKRS